MINSIALVTVSDLVRDPSSFNRKPFGGKGMIEHLICHRKIRLQHLTAQLNLPVRIKIIRSPVLGNVAGKIKICPQEIIERIHKFIPADSAEGFPHILSLPTSEPFQQLSLLLCLRLIFVSGRHFSGE